MRFFFESVSLIFIIFVSLNCRFETVRETPIRNGFVTVESSGTDREDAIRNAKLSMIDGILGEWVESESIFLDSGSRSFIIQSSREGFIREFKILNEQKKDSLYRIRASGYVDQKVTRDALEERYRLLGKPRMLVFISENVGAPTFESGTESRLISLLSGFEIKDSDSLKKNPKLGVARSDLEVAKSLAKQENCELLLFGSFETRQGDPLVEGSTMRATFANLQYKLIETETSRVLASDRLEGGKPAIDLQYGTEKAREEILSRLVPDLKRKLAEEWKRGYSILIDIDRLSYDAFVDSEMANRIRSLRGVNFVSERGKDSSGKISLQVEALFNGARLYSLLREFQSDLGLSLVGKEIKGNYLRIDAVPIPGNIRK
ncbi:hypothetical protein EHQ27_04065 [Leptospira wolffii]|uniref:hypothetical protein n=1 Tax=Leptospira wolffii TaxID=409998 RepID=UPI00034B4277|nr:hypothetical protein [Leptospira wolffii]TGK61688.1 hypothetical protein EHQ32_02200 [Leptospira wolffii]TGK70232.1 hypothetical protein EHQ35_17615 [Leptospira wolffii]TGK77155.1 hypothetical protein EHQ27_04065 [Leptospira wolffii]TGL30993.1 hypothetical protein EHQ57_06195 [Leptospira wolffii]